MGPKEWGSISGQRRKKKFTDAYNENPNICQQCGKVIKLQPGQKPSEARKKKFCSRSCATTYNNKLNPKRSASIGVCQKCGKEDIWKKYPSGTYSRRKYCPDCFSQSVSDRFRKTLKPLEDMTKGELRDSSSNSHWFKTKVSRHARKIYEGSGKSYRCYICGYDFKIHVSHIKDVKDFPREALIGEINSLDNLVALCPNHHCEFDEGHFSIRKE